MLGQTICGDATVPAGFVPLTDADVTPAMRDWAVAVNSDPRTTFGDIQYRMFEGHRLAAIVQHHAICNGVPNTDCTCKGTTLFYAPEPNPAPTFHRDPLYTTIALLGLGLTVFGVAYGIAHSCFARPSARSPL